MPSSSSSNLAHKRFNLQTKDNSQELHDKLTNILDRFEETRQAIKDNVKMLETISDCTSDKHSSRRTGNSTLDSLCSEPGSSFLMRGRSLSSTGLGSLDMNSGLCTNYGLRTMSSVDSGVMLTLTSCSDMGTQSRSRSLGSWNGGTSPTFLTQGDELQDIEVNNLRLEASDEKHSGAHNSSISSHTSLAEEELQLSNSRPSCVDDEGGDVFDRPLTQPQTNEVLGEKDCQSPHRLCCREEYSESSEDENTDEDTYDEEEYDTDRFETQEHCISFTEEDSGIYHVLSPVLLSNNCSRITQSASRGQPFNTKDSTIQPAQSSMTCIVLPAVKKLRRQSSITSHLEFQDAWMERDHLVITDTVTSSVHSSLSNVHSLEDSRHSSRLIFSPIPEESSSEVGQDTLNRRRNAHKHPLLSRSKPAIPHAQLDSKGMLGPENQILTEAQIFRQNSEPGCEFLRDVRPPTNHLLQEQNQKFKKYRHKRRKSPHAQNARSPVHCALHLPLASTSSSGSSVLSTTHKSDALSLSSYRNAIDRHAIILPQVTNFNNSKQINESNSSSSSPSYDDLRYTSSSSSSCSDSEYEYQVSLQYPNIRSRKPRKSEYIDANRPKPPVMRKINRDTKMSYKNMSSISNQQEPEKTRLFMKNSSARSKQKQLMKSKSDEASHSLLRYFRFPSPPRTTEDNSDCPKSERQGHSENSTHLSRSRPQESDSTGQEISQKNASRDGLAQRVTGASASNMCLRGSSSSSTDTASELAYPDLNPSYARKAGLLRKKNRGVLAEEQVLESSHHFPPTGAAIDRPFDRSREEPANLHIPTSMPISYAPYKQSSTATGNYTLHVPNRAQPKKNNNRCSLFQKLFRKRKSKRVDARNHKVDNLDSRLMLDLAGGEVKVKPQHSAYSVSEGVSYVMIPTSDNHNISPRYADYTQDAPTVAQSAYDTYVAQAQMATESPQAPVYMLPRLPQINYQPVNTSQRGHRYLTEETPANLSYINHTPRLHQLPVQYGNHPVDRNVFSIGYPVRHHPARASPSHLMAVNKAGPMTMSDSRGREFCLQRPSPSRTHISRAYRNPPPTSQLRHSELFHPHRAVYQIL